MSTTVKLNMLSINTKKLFLVVCTFTKWM